MPEDPAAPTPEGGGEARPPALTRPLLYGGVAAAAVAGLWLATAGILGVTSGLLVVAIAGGYLVGLAVSAGWSADPSVNGPAPGVAEGAGRPTDRRPQLLAALLGAAAWLVGTYLAYLWGLFARPASSAPFIDRVRESPFLETLAAQLSVLELLQIGILVLVAWRVVARQRG